MRRNHELHRHRGRMPSEPASSSTPSRLFGVVEGDTWVVLGALRCNGNIFSSGVHECRVDDLAHEVEA